MAGRCRWPVPRSPTGAGRHLAGESCPAARFSRTWAESTFSGTSAGAAAEALAVCVRRCVVGGAGCGGAGRSGGWPRSSGTGPVEQCFQCGRSRGVRGYRLICRFGTRVLSGTGERLWSSWDNSTTPKMNAIPGIAFGRGRFKGGWQLTTIRGTNYTDNLRSRFSTWGPGWGKWG